MTNNYCFYQALRHATALCCVCAVTTTVSANEFYQLTLGAGTEDNVPRIAHNLAIADSSLLQAQFSVGKMFVPAINHSLVVSGELSNKRYIDMRGFDTTAIGTALSYTYKMGLGAYAPRIGATLSARYENLRGEARDHQVIGSEVTLEKRLSPSWVVSAGADYRVSRGEAAGPDVRLQSFGYDPDSTLPSDLYNDDARSVFANVNYEMANGYLINLGYSRTDGFAVSSAEIPTLKMYKISKAITADPAWSTLWFGYRLPADIDDWTVSLSVPVGRDSSLDLGASWQDISAPQDTGYRNRSVTLSFIHNF